MNYSTAVMLFNEDIRAVKATFEDLEENPNAKITVFKTLDHSIEKDDLVIVPTDSRHGYTVVKVVETDAEVDFDDSTEIKWIMGKLDLKAANDTLEKEKHWINQMKKAEARARREKIKKDMLDMYEEADADKLAISDMTATNKTEEKGE